MKKTGIPLFLTSRFGFLPLAIACGLLVPSLSEGAEHTSASSRGEHALTVTATAYNASREQTDGKPHIGAWGDRVDQVPAGTRAIAVSPDLLDQGLRPGTHVRLEGLDGDFVVLDRTAADRHHAIDIFMGNEAAAAKNFGKKRLKLRWSSPDGGGKTPPMPRK